MWPSRDGIFLHVLCMPDYNVFCGRYCWELNVRSYKICWKILIVLLSHATQQLSRIAHGLFYYPCTLSPHIFVTLVRYITVICGILLHTSKGKFPTVSVDVTPRFHIDDIMARLCSLNQRFRVRTPSAIDP